MIRRIVVAAVGAGLVLGVGACSSSAGGGPSGASSSATRAGGIPANGTAVDAATFAAALQSPGTVVVDVRTPSEFASGHLVGARNIDVNAADFATTIGALAKDAPYAVYCHSGNRSGTAVAAMTKAGFTHTFHLAGGITAWTAAGGSVVTGP
jgi:rhodanese-related sulfurtransferase